MASHVEAGASADFCGYDVDSPEGAAKYPEEAKRWDAVNAAIQWIYRMSRCREGAAILAAIKKTDACGYCGVHGCGETCQIQ